MPASGVNSGNRTVCKLSKEVERCRVTTAKRSGKVGGSRWSVLASRTVPGVVSTPPSRILVLNSLLLSK